MQRIQGMLDASELVEAVRNGTLDTVLVAFPDAYGRLMGKRFDAEFFLKSAAQHGTHACDYLLTVDMEMNPVPGYSFANWEKGYGDFHLTPDLATLRKASWLDRTALVIADVRNEATHELVPEAPRSILQRQAARAGERGFHTLASSELEYYIFTDSYRDAGKKGYAGLDPAGWYLEDYHALQGAREEYINGAIRRHLKQSGVPPENTKGEWGLGQHETNVECTDVLTMADRHVVYKQCAKEVADQLGSSITFMAKFSADQAGSSCHLHLSLWNGDRPAFAGKEKVGRTECSETFRHFLGGWIAMASEVTPFYAPTVNSYKRFQSASWAPTRLAWSYDNRTAGFRVVGRDKSLRIECRIPGADCNPYLAFAASLASGLWGIERKLEPPAMYQGDVYASRESPRVLPTLRVAADRFAKSEFAREAFGAGVVDHYAHFFHSEQDAFDQAVTDWERRRYFERI